MEIDPHIAQTIVENLKGIIRHDINFFDARGRMIASTDRTRIGTLHEAARLAAERKRMVAVDGDGQFAGARNGINAPVMFNGTVAAVIGVTGRRSEVEPFGIMITKMTEILIRENVEQLTRFDRRLMMTNLVSLLVSPQRDANLIDYLAASLDVNLSMPRRAVFGRCTGRYADHTRRDLLLDVLESTLADRPAAVFSASAQGFCVLLDAQGGADGEAGGSADGSTSAADADMQLIERMRQRIERALGRPISMGVGSTAEAARYPTSYRQAQVAVDWLRFTAHAGVIAYDDLDLGMILPAIDADAADRFVARIFADLPPERIDAFRAAFDAYTARNGSVTRAAQDLFIHKNTLQNHLNDLAARTGYNPRRLDDHTTLALAFLLRDYRAFRAG
ncbi:sugar diacid recognition [Bifidobacterium sp. DSM 109958]|uniref:Sugar diacid recognition n=1 Tax=Bifidobacterium moraviense TaxID=2675323 RepID=A0A7Y0HXN8_9BIFI|nr:sugar diacid recognition [Bifidobacterium sp. DSM 109958]